MGDDEKEILSDNEKKIVDEFMSKEFKITAPQRTPEFEMVEKSGSNNSTTTTSASSLGSSSSTSDTMHSLLPPPTITSNNGSHSFTPTFGNSVPSVNSSKGGVNTKRRHEHEREDKDHNKKIKYKLPCKYFRKI